MLWGVQYTALSSLLRIKYNYTIESTSANKYIEFVKKTKTVKNYEI